MSVEPAAWDLTKPIQMGYVITVRVVSGDSLALIGGD
jgi:hypothetical protein